MMSTLLTRNLTAANGTRTSIRIEPEFWCAMVKICKADGIRIDDLVKRVEAVRKDGQGLTTAIRVYVLDHYVGLAP